MPAAAEPELAEKSLPFPEQYVLLQAVPAAERQAELAEKADAAPTAQAEASDIRLVMDVSTELSQEFPQKPRHRIIDELLAALADVGTEVTHRSTSPRTGSTVEIMVMASDSDAPRMSSGMACRLTKLGVRTCSR